MKLIDLHCDTITECHDKNAHLENNDFNISLKKARSLDTWYQFFAIWIIDGIRGIEAERRYTSVYKFLLNEISINSYNMALCGSYDDILSAREDKKSVCLLSIEGSAALNGKISKLYEYYDNGVRMITLTWNKSCEAGDGCFAENPQGLTDFGFELVREMSKLGIVVDVSHLSMKGFDDVVKTTDKPFMASHSNARAVCDNPRNLTDDQFKEIVRRKGIVGLNFYTEFIKTGGEVSFTDLDRHIDHFLSLGGENAISLGSDFDGCDLPIGLSGINDTPKLYEFIESHYSRELADKIFFTNADNFLKTALSDGKSCKKIMEKI